MSSVSSYGNLPYEADALSILCCPQSCCLNSNVSGPCGVRFWDDDGQHAIGIGRLHLILLHRGRQCKGAPERAARALNTSLMMHTPGVDTLTRTGDHHCSTFKLDGNVMHGHARQIDLNN